MSRSLSKPPYIHKSLFSKSFNRKDNFGNNNLLNKKFRKVNKNLSKFVFFKKNSFINMNLLDKKISIYNGKVFVTLYGLKKVVGYKLGAFCITRRKPPHAGKQKQVKKVSRSLERLVKERKKIVSKKKT